MIEIDGSFGEGGGQIIRTAISLAAITGKGVEIKNIRSNRPKPGLAAQHLNAVKAVKRLSDGKIEGLTLGSLWLKFFPSKIKAFEGEIDIGTAGSITLLLQCLIPAALFADEETKIRIRGGTDVKWSPSIDYYTNVFAKAIREMGCDVQIELKRRGYYPRGGGLVEAIVAPLSLSSHRLKGLKIERERIEEKHLIKGISHSTGLPAHIAERQAKAAERMLTEKGYYAEIDIEPELEVPSKSVGSGITLWLGYKGGCALGERGKRAESVGEEAARNILTELESNSSIDVDIHLADQLIPYIALSEGKSEMKVRKVTKHLETNIYIMKKFLDVKFSIEKLNRGKEREGEVVVIKKE